MLNRNRIPLTIASYGAERNCKSVPPPSMVCTWIRWFLFSVLAALPAGGVTFLSRQESNQRSDQRRGAEQFSYRNSLLFGTFLPGKNHPLLWTPLPARPSCRLLFSNRFLSLRDNFLNPWRSHTDIRVAYIICNADIIPKGISSVL